jgi:2-polyprenyl-3-methyl-5-hydroxy-6-metoxy-1,4-benzoquinol methylase
VSQAEFDAWADVYDLIHQGVPGEAEFYVGQAVRLGGRTLDIGCGTGRIALPMAMSGLDVTGLDNSKEMLDICRGKQAALGDEVRGSFRLVQADMRTFALDEQFDFIAMPYRTFMHCLTPDDQRACLDRVRQHLAPNGTFILNLWEARPGAIAPHLGLTGGSLRIAGRYEWSESCFLLHWCASRFEELQQLLAEDHLLQWVEHGSGAIVETRHLSLRRAWLTLREMQHLTEAAGLRCKAVFGDFDCNPVSHKTREMIWVLDKS